MTLASVVVVVAVYLVVLVASRELGRADVALVRAVIGRKSG
jgi:hypothetical protein